MKKPLHPQLEFLYMLIRYCATVRRINRNPEIALEAAQREKDLTAEAQRVASMEVQPNAVG